MSNDTTPGTCPFCGGQHPRYYRCRAEYEARENDYELRQQEDPAWLVSYYQAIIEWVGASSHMLQRLAEAHVLNGQPEKALELLAEPHRRHPSDEDVQVVILDALFAMGRDESDFDWVQRVEVYRLAPSLLDRCHAYLEPKRFPVSVYQLHTELGLEAYCAFTAEELLEAIAGDPRFAVDEEGFGGQDIRVRKERDDQPAAVTPRGDGTC